LDAAQRNIGGGVRAFLKPILSILRRSPCIESLQRIDAAASGRVIVSSCHFEVEESGVLVFLC
jgi:hypothetical protein